MCETSDGEQEFDGFSEQDKEKAKACLKQFTADQFDYFVVYQKQGQKTIKEFHFNQVKRQENGDYLIAMHHEDTLDHISYYNGEALELSPSEILKVKKVDPNEYDFVVYTD
ncbi:hypothetical protein [Amphibacillus cookii]|uniref:hypothetical protein n=1 Tax=Amphibacillus cookii TaxID=767787 RepID=UPI00195C49D0|nr:hypothetical protein [Amphibacillus cookii]MBM7541759.1 hypothetical protein [Amphibacillus cookii]